MPKHETRNVLLSNLENKYNLVMKFGHFMSHNKRKILSKNPATKTDWKLVLSCL